MLAEHARKFFGSVCVDDVGSGHFASGIHPHVQRAAEARTESPLCRIDLMAADSKVGQDAIHRNGLVQFQEISGVTEVVRNNVKRGSTKALA
jgi:hypothetical protein